MTLLGITSPKSVSVGSKGLSSRAWHYGSDAHTLTLTLPPRSVSTPVTIGYR